MPIVGPQLLAFPPKNTVETEKSGTRLEGYRPEGGADVAEFSQHGAIVTLHRLGSDHASIIETQLEEFARTRPIALVLPCLFDELSRPALKNIVNDLRHVRYLHRIVVSLGKAPPDGNWNDCGVRRA